MKKTFSKGCNVAVDCKGSLALKKFLVEYALSKDVSVYDGTLEDVKHGDDQYPNVTWSGGEVCGTHATTPDSCKTWISVETFMEYCDNWKEHQPIEVKLNGDYTAIIHKEDKVIKVGCQTFSFEIMEQLYKAMHD
jgi:hypothetical protein